MNPATHQEHKNDVTVFGFWLYIMSDCLLFASLFATFAVLRFSTAGGPDAEMLFRLPYVLLETLVLLTSSFTCGLALMALHKGRKNILLLSLAVTGILGAIFLGLEINEFREILVSGASWQTSAFLSAFFTLLGTHGAHVTAGIIWIVVLLVHAASHGITESTERRLTSFALFWHFLDIIWIFIFSFVYLLPLTS